MSVCPTCLGRNFVYSPGGYAPKVACPTCGKGPIPKAVHLTCAERPEEVVAARDRVREFAFDMLQPFINEGDEPTPYIEQLTHDLFTLINASHELLMLKDANQ